MRVLVILLLSLSIVLPEVVWSKQQSVILVVGDSLSAAYGIDPDKGWVSLLGQRIQQKSFPYRVVNASVSGDTTQNGLLRLPSSLEKHQPDVVIIELGGNDGLRGLSLKAMKYNLAQMIELARQKGAQVVLVGIRIPPNYGKRYTDAFYNVYVNLAQSYDAVLIPFLLDSVGDREHLMQADGIHPTVEAQPIMLDNVWSHLRSVLKN